MQKQTLRLSLFALALLFFGFLLAIPSNSAPRPLSKSELLALVAGDCLPENTVGEIQSRGITFTPDDKYKSLLKAAGADAKVLAALSTAKIAPAGHTNGTESSALLQHLSAAGKMIRANQYDQATAELSAAVTNDFGKSEAGFVMGNILLDQQRYAEAGELYSEIFGEDPDFPQLHTRLSATYYDVGDLESALREAKAAIAENPNNPVAHLNAGLALTDMRKFDAAKAELQASIRSKPDYARAYAGLGSVLDELHDFDGAAEQYKKALALNPDANTHYNLGVTFGNKGDFVSAIREYREAKRLDPKRLDVRQNLGAALIHTDPAAAVVEFRELTALAPDWPIRHACLGNALMQTGRLQEAEKEYRTAATLDPASSHPHEGLGRILESNRKYDEALEEYRIAVKLDPSSGECHTDVGRMLVLKKDYPPAIAVFKQAVQVDPANPHNYDLLGQALENSGNRDAAIAEYREALSVGPKDVQARLDLASALEKKGDWVAALDNYHQAALNEPPVKSGIAQRYYDAQRKYENAQQRFQQHLADLRSTGKSSEADKLEAALRAKSSTAGLDEKFHDAMQAGQQAMKEKRLNDAETSVKQAVEIAEKIQPPDGRLPEAVGALGAVYAWRLDWKDAIETYKRQLALSEKLYGPKSPMITMPLRNLALVAAQQQDYAGAEAYFSRAIDLNEAAYGLDSSAAADLLRGLAAVYMKEQNFAKSESLMLRVVGIYEHNYGEQDLNLSVSLGNLCYLYDQWGKPDKSAPCHARLLAMQEKQFGPDSPYLVRELTSEAKALRQLGRNEEAAKLEQRTQSLQSAQTNPN